MPSLGQLTPIGQDKFSLTTPRMRSNRVVSDRSWIARITGRHPKFGLAREFRTRTTDQVGNDDGDQTFSFLHVGEIYEVRQLMWDGQSGYSYAKGRGITGFFRLTSEGTFEELTRAEALAGANAMDEQRAAKIA